MKAAQVVSRMLCRVWFRTVRRVGEDPPAGATLYLLNHSNALIDPMVASALLTPAPRFLAKHTLWDILPVRPLLKLYNPIEVRRAQDLAAGRLDRGALAQTFASVHAAFAAGDAVALFPEGVSHGAATLAPLKTGAARVALGSPVAPHIVPVGLIYSERTRFRQDVLLRVGPPIPYADLYEKAAGVPTPSVVNELTARMRAGLMPMTLHPDEHNDLAHALERLLNDNPFDLEQRWARVHDIVERLQKMPEAERTALADAVARVSEDLRAQGALEQAPPAAPPRARLPGLAARTISRHALALALMPAAALFAPPILLAGWLGRRLTKDTDMIATNTYMAAILFTTPWLVGLCVAAGVWATAAAAVPVLAFPLAAATVPLTESLRKEWALLRSFGARHARDVALLQRARAHLLETSPHLR